jgi:DNA-binding NarL/FixJ family response regulator
MKRKMSPMPNRADLKDSLKIRVLLVDDNEPFLHVATDFLQRQHELTVVGAICGGEEALAQAQDLQPQVILIGLERPGLETVTRLRNMLPGVGIIALTLLEGNAYRQAALAAGADDLVPKARLTSELLPAIRRVTQANRSR